MNFLNFDFIFEYFLQRKKIYTLKLIGALNFSLFHYDIYFFIPLKLRFHYIYTSHLYII